jgi:hypothetical protein
MEGAAQAFVTQSAMIQALLAVMRGRAGSTRVRLLETHISWVILAGHYAYKVKKAVNLGFLNFTSLEQRQYYCAEEIRLNRRLAPKIYLDVVPIGGSQTAPLLGVLPAIEYAVRMHRFAVSKQFDRLLASNRLLPHHIDSLATTISSFHGGLPAADKNSSFGTAEGIRRDAEQNFGLLMPLLKDEKDVARIAELRVASDQAFSACSGLFGPRRLQGFVRECHGDLHLGNIVWMDGQAVPFDGIEFSAELRWIDVMNEVAFTVMDLLHYQRAALAYRFLDAYLQASGDFSGIRVLRFYLAYRAMVRAKVSAIRAVQPDQAQSASAESWAACRSYMQLAGLCLARTRPALIVTCGLPGSGKTTFSQIALERLGAIRLRSDVERKRMFGLSPLADSRASIGVDLYSEEITRRTYARLLELARMLLLEGYTVIVDAAFPRQEERELFHRLAAEQRVRFVIAAIEASTESLRARILQRHRTANDASEADVEVLEKLLLSRQALTAAELGHAVTFINESPGIAANAGAWNSLDCLLKE